MQLTKQDECLPRWSCNFKIVHVKQLPIQVSTFIAAVWVATHETRWLRRVLEQFPFWAGAWLLFIYEGNLHCNFAQTNKSRWNRRRLQLQYDKKLHGVTRQKSLRQKVVTVCYYEIGGLPFGTKISKTWYCNEVKYPTWKASAGEGKGRKMERETTEGDWDERKLSRTFLLLATPPVCARLAG